VDGLYNDFHGKIILPDPSTLWNVGTSRNQWLQRVVSGTVLDHVIDMNHQKIARWKA